MQSESSLEIPNAGPVDLNPIHQNCHLASRVLRTAPSFTMSTVPWQRLWVKGEHLGCFVAQTTDARNNKIDMLYRVVLKILN